MKKGDDSLVQTYLGVEDDNEPSPGVLTRSDTPTEFINYVPRIYPNDEFFNSTPTYSHLDRAEGENRTLFNIPSSNIIDIKPVVANTLAHMAKEASDHSPNRRPSRGPRIERDNEVNIKQKDRGYNQRTSRSGRISERRRVGPTS